MAQKKPTPTVVDVDPLDALDQKQPEEQAGSGSGDGIVVDDPHEAPGTDPEPEPEPEPEPTVKDVVDDLLGINERDAMTIRGLMAAGRLMAAVRHYRELRPGSSVEVAQAIVERLAELGPPPADFALPALDGPPPTLEETVVHPLGSEPPAGELHQLPPPAPRTDLVVLHGRKVLRRADEDRRFPLSPEVFHAKALDLANNLQAIGVEEARQKQVKAALKASMGALEEQGAKLAAEIRDGCEVLQVRVIYEADYDEGIVREINEATNEVLATKPIAGADAQVPMFDGAGVAAGDNEEEEEEEDDESEEEEEEEEDDESEEGGDQRF